MKLESFPVWALYGFVVVLGAAIPVAIAVVLHLAMIDFSAGALWKAVRHSATLALVMAGLYSLICVCHFCLHRQRRKQAP